MTPHRLLALVAIVLAVPASTHASADPIVLAENGRSDYVIVHDATAPLSTRHAARELRRYLKEITGAELLVESDKEAVQPHEIVLGNNRHLASLNLDIDFAALGDDGYVLRTVGRRLVIAGGELRGNLYGVYGLLEDHLGCRWFTPDVSQIPSHTRLDIDAIDETVVPVLEYRWPAVRDCYDGDWCARNRVNVGPGLEQKHGGGITFCGWAHTFVDLVPVDRYFDEHPEYFALVNGQRCRERTQLCCTNDDVIRIVTQGIRQRMRDNPDATYFSVSQNDWGNHCECEKCQALADREGSQMGPVLALVNRVAQAVEDEFPTKRVTTLAYQWSRKPPASIRPRPNVTIRLCSNGCCFAHGLATCDDDANIRFRQDITGWSAICNNLWVWNYTTNFREYYLPHPSLRALNDDIRFYVAHHVKGIYEQDTKLTLNGDMSPLGGYLMAKLLWNPEYDEDTAINEFLAAVYEEAAPSIRRYIDLIHDKVDRDHIHLRSFTGADAAFLTREVLEQADALWDEAEAAVADKPTVRERVAFARMPVDYAFIRRTHMAPPVNQTLDHARFTVMGDPALNARIQRFLATAKRAGVLTLHERRETLDEFEASLSRIRGGVIVPLEAVTPPDTGNGIAYRYFEAPAWSDPFDPDALEPVEAGILPDINLGPRRREHMFAIAFDGFIEAPRDGLYTFHVRAETGSYLDMGRRRVIGPRETDSRREIRRLVGLKQGWHPIRFVFREHACNDGLTMAYEGPGIERQPIATSVLRP